MFLWLITTALPAQANTRLVVSPQGPYTTIQAALDEARDGDTIEVRGGNYRGPVVVEKAVTLEGVDWPVIDNGGMGTVVTLNAANAVLRGFELRGSGTEPDQDHSGIVISAPHVTAENNRLNDVLFGIFVAKASDAIVRGNEITSKPEFDIARKGDAIRLWYSPRTLVENNHVYSSRDLVIWYSTGVVIRDNIVERGRYGIHLMYCDGAQIERNRILDNSVGIYTMYSNNIAVRENLIHGQRGPSGYALGFKDVDNVEVAHNVLVDNRAAFYLDGMPFNPQGYGRVHENVIAFNDVGVIMLPAVRGNTFENNTFWENVEQVAVQGGGTLGANKFEGNYWSDYAGFDANGDGRGDVPYRAEHFFEGLTDREPMLRMLIYSPAQQAIEFASSAFPIVRPKVKFSDPAPSIQPLPLPAFAANRQGNPGAMTLAALALLGVSGVFGVIAMQKNNRTRMNADERGIQRIAFGETDKRIQATEHPLFRLTSARIVVNAVTKRYGKVKALDAVSFEARPGEALAFWGANGAGKTTLLKAILGLIDFQGDIQIQDCDVKRAPKLARRNIGYVPQEAVFYDLSVQATLDFYARLKKADPARAASLLARVGLSDHASKPVPALSGGLKQRLALAIALLADPPVLLLDEPTANLDSQARREYLELLATLHREGKTILFASHRIEEVEALADRVLVVKGGQLDQVLTPEQLRVQFMPHVQMTLWITEIERAKALARLNQDGVRAHSNGRGTIVLKVRAEDKMQPLQALRDEGVSVLDFEIEGVSSWN
ncbi:MAG: nitrous oxide reductase family maturation protein NosD [Chloroflexi bacterium]|nr:nitrous oxide reductase family maturation protein NosD [Chloroflexota bacterium]